jgi:hypothetical protein
VSSDPFATACDAARDAADVRRAEFDDVLRRYDEYVIRLAADIIAVADTLPTTEPEVTMT